MNTNTNKPSYITFGNDVINLQNIAYFSVTPSEYETNKFVIVCHLYNNKKITHGEFPSQMSAHVFLCHVYSKPGFISMGNEYVIRADYVSHFHVMHDKSNKNLVVIIAHLNNNKTLSWGCFHSKNDALVHLNRAIMNI